MSNFVCKNSEILFLYDAKRCNPNGDMDNENKPRMDWDAGRNLVSDVRLKRYIRDYLISIKKVPVFVRKLGEEALSAKEAIGLFKLHEIEGKPLSEISKKDLNINEKEMRALGSQILDMIDIRLFGATIPIDVETGKGASSNFTGPVQFNWGYSLNKIFELQESKTITSHFKTGQSSAGAGVGKDYRVNYSFIAFSGGINANTGSVTQLQEEDIDILDEAMIKSIPLSRTRSKVGQTPRLYLRFELIDNARALNDLREHLSLDYSIDNEENLRDIQELKLNIDNLIDYIESNTKEIQKLVYWKDKNLNVRNFEKLLSVVTAEELSY
ncbi:MAG: type I-B CRISPR-associated protein Cas7/Csh2 [Candidatus Lokiarchaeota archaeon]|nr:type I-B CRISPR-associated protein Cas7/Csh2 [Candidatus Lokiarchaeota archaeon]